MERYDTDQLNLQMLPVPEDITRDNRYIRLLSSCTSGFASVISIFCTGLVSGAAGGLLLGATAVVALQSLELLADNRLLMDELEKYIMGDYHSEKKVKDFFQWESNNQVHDIRISIFAVLFGVFSSTLSSAVGIYIALSVYSLVIKKEGEAGMEKTLAGPVCLMGVTATGYILGLTLESFLSFTLNVDLFLWFLISLIVSGWLFPTLIIFSNSYMFVLVCGIVHTPVVSAMTYILSFLLEMRLILVAVFIPTILAVKVLEKTHSLKMTTVPVPLMLIISDIYIIKRQQIIAVQSPTSTNTSRDVMEAIFVGDLASLLWMVTVGMSVRVSWQRGRAGKIWATSAGFGTTVLGVIKLALPVLGPGPTIGALMGVAGAVGVCFSAAVAATDQYGQVVDYDGMVGRVGVTVGAAVGAFLSSCAHSGLSGMFMSLCAATIHAGAFLKLLLYSTPWRFRGCSCIYLVPAVVTLYTCTITFSTILFHSTNNQTATFQNQKLANVHWPGFL